MNIYPELLETLIEYFKKLPGIGEKTAERYALSLINFEGDDLKDFASAIENIEGTLKKCDICGHLTDQKICKICEDSARNHNLICVVEDYKSIFMFEKTGKFSGVYHVLGGLISPIDGINPDDLNISKLINRTKELTEAEVIIALRPTIEGDTTTLYLKKILDKEKIKITRLSYGIPMGAEIDYLDILTLERALYDRKEVA
ncbi:MAG: recombination protein RecR [Bacilli bacterium]|nr:recombination protein RecR [Bacilli bacterium]